MSEGGGVTSVERVLAFVREGKWSHVRERDSVEATRACCEMARRVFGTFRFFPLGSGTKAAKARTSPVRLRLARGATQWANLLHDVAHYQVAAASRRHLRGFGLGWDPDGLASGERLVSGRFSVKEESLASVLGVLWEAGLGMDFGYTLSEHNWMENAPDDSVVAACCSELERLGIVVAGEPTPKLRDRRIGFYNAKLYGLDTSL